METKYITLTKENIDTEHICCAFSDKKCSEGYEMKKAWLKKEFDHKPTSEEVKSIVLSYYNREIESSILSGMEYEGVMVWLSTENQFNYKAAYDLAVQTQGQSLPVVFKFGTDDEPQYREFTTVDELNDFYQKSISYVLTKLQEGWKKKDSFDVKLYQ